MVIADKDSQPLGLEEIAEELLEEEEEEEEEDNFIIHKVF